MEQAELLQHLRPDVDLVDQAMREDFAEIASPLLQEVLHYAVFNGGKRIRPLLTVLAARICGASGAAEVYRLAMLFEYLHVASLLHDDVVDRSEIRRGRTSANLVWGNPAAILAGDFLHARAMHLAGTVGGIKGLEIISGAINAMVEAEFLQIANVREQNLDEASYFLVLQGKTAALIGAACEVGALFAGADAAGRQALRSYGEQLGLAFQVVDDLLDYWGDPQVTGKAVGNDFVEGKMTLPLIYTLEKLAGAERDKVMGLLKGDAEERRRELPFVKRLIEDHGGLEYSRERAKGLIDVAVGEIEKFSVCEAGKLLTVLAHYVLTRKK